jgi:hypothetical protein
MNIVVEINNILWNDWDPIELNFNQHLSDEYNMYAQKIYQLNNSSKLSELEIYNLLLDYETSSIGIQIEDTKRYKVANKIFLILI